MENCRVIILFLIVVLIGGCATTGGTKTTYGGKIKLPEHGNYSTPSQLPVVPVPGQSLPELKSEDLEKTFYIPFADAFTASLKALKDLDYSLTSFNSDTGVIEFKTIQGQSFIIRLTPDERVTSRSVVKILNTDGSRKFNREFVSGLFNAITKQLKP